MAVVELRTVHAPDATVYEDGTQRRAEIFEVHAVTDYDECYWEDDDLTDEEPIGEYRVLWSWTPDWKRKRKDQKPG